MKFAITIFKKDIRDSLRDRRTLASMIIMPVLLMPALILGMGWFADMQMRQSQQKEIKLGVVNGQAAGELLEHVASQDRVVISQIEGEPEASVRDGKVDLVIIIPGDWREALEGQRPVSVPMLFNSTESDSSVLLGRLTAALESYNTGLIERRIRGQGLNVSLLTTPDPTPTDVATSEERGGSFLGFLLPMFLVLWAITGGMYTAIDVSAGEKERKTLEPLLSTPVSRLNIVIGKLLAVSLTSVTAITLALASLYVGLLQFGNSGLFGPGGSPEGIRLSLAPGGIAVMFGVGVLLAIMFAAIELGLSIFAKSYREAQSYLTPMYLAAFLPIVVVNTFAGMEPTAAMFSIPAVNAVLLFKEVLLGTLNAAHVMITLASLTICAAAAVSLSVRIYEREGVLFRT